MAKPIGNIPAIEPFVVEDNLSTNLDKKWSIWKDDLELFLVASGISQDAQKKALLLHLRGKDLKEIYRSLQATEDKYEDVITKLDNYFRPKKNVTYERYLFKQTKQKSEESSSSFVTRLRRLAETCEFTNVDVEIKDQFIVMCRSTALKKKLLRESELTLSKLLDIARSDETARIQASDMDKKAPFEEINTVRSRQDRRPIKYANDRTRQFG